MKRFAVSAVRIGLVVCLLVSSWFHLPNQYSFVADIHNYRLTPAFVSIFLASVLPYFQIGLAACLVVRPFTTIAAFFSSLLFLAFFSAQMIALLRGININCGCFGGASQPISFWTIGFAAILSGLSIVVYRAGDFSDTAAKGETAS